MPEAVRVAYLSLQEVAEGLDSWAAVNEIVVGLEDCGFRVDRWFPRYGPKGAPGPFARLVEMIRLQRELIARLGEYDVLYVRGHPLAWMATRVAVRRGLVVVQECNGMYADLYIAWPQTRPFRFLFDRLQRSQYAISSLVVCVTDRLAEWVVSEAPGAMVETIPNGVNVDVFHPDAPRYPDLPRRFAVFFGNFAPWQGIPTLLEAARGPRWPQGLSLVLVGDGQLRPEVEVAAAQSDRVVYLGHVPYGRMAEVVGSADVSVIPLESREREGAGFSPLKLYESIACGVPVVASDAGGVGEWVVDRKVGMSFATGDASALADSVARVVSNEPERRAIGERARTVAVDECAWSARAARRAHLIERMVRVTPT